MENADKILAAYSPNRKEGLIPILQDLQEEFGFLTDDLLDAAGRYLNLPSNKVYGVATFYDQFRFQPRGHVHIRICRGTSCHLYGSHTYLDELENQLSIKAGSTRKDRRVSLEVTTCLGACESAPVIRVNDTSHRHVTPADLDRIIRSVKEKTE
ncbi:MAG TPA: NAD(P)H-dependent oxidoreductase subunit E [Bacteroidales bacterium]|nr:NAD(P)H-dependent oxidoreductase subunit E [Bacteroidales bacterium]